jgi:hypothetical protein
MVPHLERRIIFKILDGLAMISSTLAAGNKSVGDCRRYKV